MTCHIGVSAPSPAKYIAMIADQFMKKYGYADYCAIITSSPQLGVRNALTGVLEAVIPAKIQHLISDGHSIDIASGHVRNSPTKIVNKAGSITADSEIADRWCHPVLIGDPFAGDYDERCLECKSYEKWDDLDSEESFNESEQEFYESKEQPSVQH
ncbi:hypothetical protein [Massilia antarctica]|uniref:hypothetical protein n=1 Tax=Massilia antarctica TaxID=2765360 RepID=UPI001E4A0601|nr:hypothetical protein [Massilia antarctica]